MIRGLTEQKTNLQKNSGTGESNIGTLGVKIELGKGLLNSSSTNEKMKLEHVPRNLIEKNEKNDRSILGIKDLAYSIEHMGLKNPLHVKRTPTGYKLLGGERRLTAIDSLIADENVSDWDEDTLIPVVVQDFDEIDLPLDDELKELFAMVTTNKETRKYTDGDKAKEIAEWKRIISALRKAGVEQLSAKNEDGEEISTQIKGVATRDILAATTNMSRGAINTFEKVNSKGAESVKDALLNNTISVQDASKIIDASDSVEEQEEMMQQIQEKGDAKQVINEAKFNKDKIKEAERIIAQDREKNDKPVTSDFFGNSTNEHKIDLKEFKSDIKAITRLLSKDERILDSNELMAYYNHIRGLEEILKVNK